MKMRHWHILRFQIIVMVLVVLPYDLWGATQQQSKSPPAISEQSLSGSVTLSDLVTYGYHKNPQVTAVRQAWHAAVENYRVVTAYPDPQLMVTYFPEPIETRLGPQDWNATVTQMIPFPGKLSKAGDVAETEIRIARIGLDKAVRDMATAIRQSYHELLYIQQAKAIVEKNNQLLNQLRKNAEAAHAQDRTAFLDVVKAQSQVGQLAYDRILLEELEATEKAVLNSLLNREPDAPIGNLVPVTVPPVVYSLDTMYQMAESFRDELKMAGLMVEKAGQMTQLARYQSLPTFFVGVYYAGIGQPDVAMAPEDAGKDALGIRFGLTIPLWMGKNISQVRKAKAEAEKRKAEYTDKVNQTRAMIRSLFFKYRNSQRLITLYRDNLLPQAMGSLETAETWFRENQGSFSDFIEAQATVYNFQLSLARARADCGKALAQLEQLVGRDLTHLSDASEQGKE